MRICAIVILPLLLCLLAGVACAAEPPPSRQDVLVSLTDLVIVPRFQSVADEMNGLKNALHTPLRRPVARDAGRRADGVAGRPRPLDALAGDVVRAGNGTTFAFTGGLVAH